MFPQPPMGNFGNKFRKAREKKNLSLDDVSNVTKIGSRMLQAIEEEHFDQLPGGVFNKGFIRAYAKHLGLDSETAITEYLACLRQAQIDSHEAWDPETRPAVAPPTPAKSAAAAPHKAAAKVQTSVGVEEELPHLQLPRAEDRRPAKKEYLGRPSSEAPWTLIAAVVIVALASVLWIRHTHRARTVAANSNPPLATLANTTEPQPGSVPVGPTRVADTRVSPHPATTKSFVPTPTLLEAHTATTKATSDANRPGSSQANIQKREESTIPTSPAASTAASNSLTRKSAESAPTTFNLVIRASENSWIYVTADGQPVTQETLIAPAHTTIRASREIVAKVGNAAGVTFTWNGQQIPAQGAESEVKTVIFDAQGMHISTPQN